MRRRICLIVAIAIQAGCGGGNESVGASGVDASSSGEGAAPVASSSGVDASSSGEGAASIASSSGVDASSSGEGAASVATSSGWTTTVPGASLVTLASGQEYPFGIVVGGDSVYWTNYLTSVMKISVEGGTAEVLAGGRASAGIAINQTNVYWGWNDMCPTDGGNCAGGGQAAVMSASLESGTVHTLVLSNMANTVSEPNFLAVDSVNIYWTTSTAPGIVQAVPVLGGTPTVFWVGSATNSSAYAVTASNGIVYWTGQDGILSMTDDGGMANTVVSPPSNAPLPFFTSIAVDAAHVYWANYGESNEPTNTNGTIMKVPLGGGPAMTLASGQHDPYAIVVDSSNVYWGNAGTQTEGYKDGAVMKVPLGGGTPTTLATGQGGVYGIAVDETSVYWTTQETSQTPGIGNVMKLTPK
jgi:hypothetical protein